MCKFNFTSRLHCITRSRIIFNSVYHLPATLQLADFICDCSCWIFYSVTSYYWILEGPRLILIVVRIKQQFFSLILQAFAF